ncbi:MAG: hypothetical protein K2N56_05190 [Oscillospiraceae bacterium]|nr:hypothetical protein [Oscillospiraceae bacterium]
MKTCDEMVNSLLKRREQFFLKQKQKRRTAAKIASAGGCCALAAVIGTGIRHSVISSNRETVIPENSSVISENSFPATSEPENITPPSLDRSSVIWASSGADDNVGILSICEEVGAFKSFNGKVITRTLSEAFKEHDDSSVFAVAVFYFPYDESEDKDFVYNGKTLGEYERDWLKKWCKSMNMHLLRNNAEYLINGEEYYQNDYWAKLDYDKGIELLAEIPDLVAEYFVDGEFLSDEFHRDHDAAYEESQASYKIYEQAYNAWKISRFEEEIERLKALGVNCELRNSPDSFVIFVTKDELAKLTFDDSGHWIFGLARENDRDVLGWLINE